MPGKKPAVDRTPFDINGFADNKANRRTFYHEFPFLDTSSSFRTKELKPIGRPTVVQSFGQKARRFTIEGNALEGDEIAHIRNLDRTTGAVPLQHEDWDGEDVIVTKVETRRARGEHEIQVAPDQSPRKVYYYKIEGAEDVSLPAEDPVPQFDPSGPQPE